MRIFLDANVVFSGANETSQLHKLLVYLAENYELYTSSYTYEEANRNISTKRPKWKDGLKTLEQIINIQNSVKHLDTSIDLVDKDRPVLSAALEFECNYLLTGDRKDFGHLFGKIIHGVKILPPNDFVKEEV